MIPSALLIAALGGGTTHATLGIRINRSTI